MSFAPPLARTSNPWVPTFSKSICGIETQDAGGYAKELSPEALQRGRDMVGQARRHL